MPEVEKLKTSADDARAAAAEAVRLQKEATTAAAAGRDGIAKQAAAAAGKYNAQAQGLFDDMKKTYGELDASDREAAAKFMGETDPLMQQLKAGGWGDDVKADAGDLAAQKDVRERYKELSDPNVTAKERLVAEMARRNFEAQDRGNREAVMQDLSQRGLNSGTLQIANNLAAQERLGQERTMAELGLQAGAVDRSMQGLAGYAGQANQLRSANDALAQF